MLESNWSRKQESHYWVQLAYTQNLSQIRARTRALRPFLFSSLYTFILKYCYEQLDMFPIIIWFRVISLHVPSSIFPFKHVRKSVRVIKNPKWSSMNIELILIRCHQINIQYWDLSIMLVNLNLVSLFWKSRSRAFICMF